MYCSNCGTKASGNFCSACGSRLGVSAAEPVIPEAELVGPADWQEECRYHVLLQVPEVRDQIARNAAKARKGLSGEKFLELCDKAFEPFIGVSIATVAAIAAPIYSRLGVKTGKSRSQVIRRPIGEVLVATLCSLARHGRSLQQVHQGQDGCVVEATLPSDMWSFEGELVISLEREKSATRVEAATRIPGQLFDWGKSTQCLDQIFADMLASGAA